MGGSARIPAIKSALQQMLGSFPVLANLNGDESAALGCIYYGSGSKFARNKLEQVWDIPTFPLYATLYRSEPLPLQFGEEETGECNHFVSQADYIAVNGGHTPSYALFAGKDGYEKERSLTLPVRADFRVLVHYRRDPYSAQGSNLMWARRGGVRRSPTIAEYVVNDVRTTIARIENHIESNVTLTFVLDSNGLVRLKKAELVSRYISQEGLKIGGW